MIQLQHIERVFMVGEEEVHALRDVSMAAEAGEYIAIMGPSGSGKSSLLNILGLLDRPDSGSYELDGTLGHPHAQDRLCLSVFPSGAAPQRL